MFHAAAAWLFFADYTLSPMAMAGLLLIGGHIHAWIVRRERRTTARADREQA